MAQTTANNYMPDDRLKGDESFDDYKVKAAAHIFAADAVGFVGGIARQLVAGDDFAGFAERESDNTAAGAADGDQTVRVRQRGHRKLTVTHVDGALVGSDADEGKLVYAVDSQTFNDHVAGNTLIGRIDEWLSGTSYVVNFFATPAKSI